MSIELGLKVAKHIAGEDGAAEVAVATARAARGAQRVVKKVRRAVDAIDNGTPAQASESKPKSIEATAATTPTAETPNLRAALAGAVAAFKQSAGTPVEVSPETGEALARVADTVKGGSLVVVGQARQLATVAGGIAPKPLVAGFRLVTANASADDVAVAMELAKRKHRGVGGFVKRQAFNAFLRQMKDKPDPAVFKLLDYSSNSCEERNVALKKISVAIRDMKVDAATALEVLDGFNDSVRVPNWDQRVEALTTLSKHFASRNVAVEVLSGFAPDDESVRLDAFKALIEQYNGMSADEICDFLVLFKGLRGNARKLVDGKLTDTENVGQIDALFEPAVKILDTKEVVQVREAVGRLLGTAGATGKAIFEGLRAGASKK